MGSTCGKAVYRKLKKIKVKKYLNILAGLTVASMQLGWTSAAHAKSVSESVCLNNTRQYAVFAKRHLLGGKPKPTNPGDVLDKNDIQLQHEHLFFCSNGKVIRNIGYNTKSGLPVSKGILFSYTDEQVRTGTEIVNSKARPLDFVVTDQELYDPKVMDDVLNDLPNMSPDQCILSTDTYKLIGNNCQTFAKNLKDQYWERIQPKITAFYCDGQKGSGTCTLNWGQAYNLGVDYERAGKDLHWQVSGFTVGSTTKEGTIKSPEKQGTVKVNGRCTCEGRGCKESKTFPMNVALANKRSSETTSSLKLICKQSAGQVIEGIVKDQVIPKIPIPSIPRLPF
jgi:hypothetical protein